MAVTIALAACQSSASNTPRCDTVADTTFILAAQAVPTSPVIPCIEALESGWRYAGSQIADGSVRLWLDSDVAGAHSVEVQMTETCDTSGTQEVPPTGRERGAHVFVLSEDLSPFRQQRFIVYEGGCVVHRYAFGVGAPSTLVRQIEESLSLLPREAVVDLVRDERHRARNDVLTNHRRAFAWSLLLLLGCVLSLFLVGRHPPQSAPQTTVSFVGTLDESVTHWVDDIRIAPLTWFFRVLAVVGAGIVTVPLRTIASVVLIAQRRWRAFSAFVLTWMSAEITLTVLKIWFHRDRPPDPLVSTNDSFSFPSGHAVAGAATAVALVLAFLPAGHDRRRWEWIAVFFSFTMAFSRVYLNAHWFSDVVAGVLLGAGIAIFWAATVTEVRDIWWRRHGRPIPITDDEPVVAPVDR
jgi:membrane-associated phospholipid phosphatase